MYQPQPWYYSHAILMVFTWGTCSCHEFIIWPLFYFIFCPVFPPTVRCVGISISPHKSPVWGSHNTHSDHLIRSNLKNENALHIFLNRISRPLNDKYSNFFIISLFFQKWTEISHGQLGFINTYVNAMQISYLSSQDFVLKHLLIQNFKIITEVH